MKWYERMPERWAIEHELAWRQLLDVETGIEADDQRAFIKGTVVLETNSGHELGRYRIKIIYPEFFPAPNAHPAVYLESHHDKWVCTLESHMPNWFMCLYVPFESGLDFGRSDELLRLLEHAYAYLYRQRLYQIDYKRHKILGWKPPMWAGPEREHGTDGLLDAILDAGGIGRNDYCVCGSGKKYKKCCESRLDPQLEERKKGKQ